MLLIGRDNESSIDAVVYRVPDEENVAELTQLANDFQTNALPVLRGFGVV
jgi:hypothetical protein